MAAPSRLWLGTTASKIPSSQIRRRFSTNWENYSPRFNGLWLPLLSSSFSALPRGSMSQKESQTKNSPGWHSLDWWLTQIRHTWALPHQFYSHCFFQNLKKKNSFDLYNTLEIDRRISDLWYSQQVSPSPAVPFCHVIWQRAAIIW